MGCVLPPQRDFRVRFCFTGACALNSSEHCGQLSCVVLRAWRPRFGERPPAVVFPSTDTVTGIESPALLGSVGFEAGDEDARA